VPEKTIEGDFSVLCGAPTLHNVTRPAHTVVIEWDSTPGEYDCLWAGEASGTGYSSTAAVDFDLDADPLNENWTVNLRVYVDDVWPCDLVTPATYQFFSTFTIYQRNVPCTGYTWGAQCNLYLYAGGGWAGPYNEFPVPDPLPWAPTP